MTPICDFKPDVTGPRSKIFELRFPYPKSRHIYAESTGFGEKRACENVETWPMTVRMSRKTVTFKRSFSLRGIDEVQPAGSYTVETDEELLPGLSFPAYRRIATLIILRSRGQGRIVEEVISIDPLELQAAQERDARLDISLADYHSGCLSADDATS
jgi:hypothetical protein